MNHQHFDEISSTQEFLLRKEDDLSLNTLISCETQTQGKGQYGRTWDSFSETLCMSFTLAANPVITLTSLEIACLIHKYFLTCYSIELNLKWPNDLLNQSQQKVGGILINKVNNIMAIGVGLNYFQNSSQKNYPTPYGFILSSLNNFSKKEEAQKIYQFCLTHRMNEEEIRSYWTKYCSHMNKNIILLEANNERPGIFLGIGKNGEAIIKLEQGAIQSFYSGSIRI